MTVAEAIRAAADRLGATSDTARLDAELLMAHSLGLSRSDMLVKAMRDEAPEEFGALVERRISHEPVAYITGTQEFYGRSFAVGPGVLIPRGDTETVIEVALELAPAPKRVLDLGTGSGALLLTMLAERPDANGLGLDASAAALEVAAANARDLGLGGTADFERRDWTAGDWASGLGTFDLILCNPPYVEEDAALQPDVRAFEPASALFSGPEGLDDYRVLVPQLGKLLNDGGGAVFEIGASQAQSVTKIAEKAGFSVEMRRDLANRPRVLIFRT